MDYQKTHQKRFQITIDFLKKHIPAGETILDLGIENPLSRMMAAEGYKVENTRGEDLDTDYHAFLNTGADVITAFEIFEHMLAPFNILRSIHAKKLVASVPLKLWFADAYWDEKDDRAKHYHEFEKKQFDFLLRKTGWQIKDAKLWASPQKNVIGIRPLLRRFYPRYYLVYCERSSK